MKVKSLLYAGALMAVALLASCSNNDGDGVQLGKGGIQFNASINGSNPVQVSRATENSWQDGDKIGIFSANDGETGFAASNVQYTTTAAGVLSAVTDGINYKDASTKTNFRAYYPYNASATVGTVPVNVTDQSDQAKLDLLYAKADGKTSADQNIALAFDHQLVKVVFNIKAGTGVTLDGLKTTLSGSATSGKFDVGTGQFTQDSNIQDILFKVASDNATAEAIVLPATSLDGKTVTFTTSDGSKGTVDLSKELKVNGTLLKSLDRGSKYTIPVTLGESTTPGEFAVSFGNATISPWNNVAGDEVIVDFGKGDTPEPGEGDGTKDKPYSVEQAIAIQDGAQYWITGYIVGYVDGGSVASGAKFEGPFGGDVNVLLAASQDEKDVAKCIPVKLKNNPAEIRATFGLKANPKNLGKQVSLYGTLKNAYGTVPSMIDCVAGIMDGKEVGEAGGETPTPTPTTAPGTLTKAADLTEGTYAIGYYNGSAYKLMTNKLKGFYGEATDWTSGEVAANCQFKLTKSGEYWQIQGIDDLYVHFVKSGNYTNLKFDGSDTSTGWSMTDVDGGGIKAVYGATGAWIAFTTDYGTYRNGYDGLKNGVYPSFYKIK